MTQIKISDFFDLTGFPHKELFKDSLPWKALDNINSYLINQSSGKIDGDVSYQAYLVDPNFIFIEKGCVVEPGAYIKGPCYLSEGTVVRQGAYLRGNVVTGLNCVIGHSTEIKNSIMLNKAKAAHFAYVGDSILGNNVNLGAGTKLANFRFDQGSIFIKVKGSKIDTNRSKLGAIIGDGAQLGCNSVTNPGALILRNSFVLPCESFKGNF